MGMRARVATMTILVVVFIGGIWFGMGDVI
jgi:hypothetical protein